MIIHRFFLGGEALHFNQFAFLENLPLKVVSNLCDEMEWKQMGEKRGATTPRVDVFFVELRQLLISSWVTGEKCFWLSWWPRKQCCDSETSLTPGTVWNRKSSCWVSLKDRDGTMSFFFFFNKKHVFLKTNTWCRLQGSLNGPWWLKAKYLYPLRPYTFW